MDERGAGLRLYVWAMGLLALVTAGFGVHTLRQLRAIEAAIPRDQKLLVAGFAEAASNLQAAVANAGELQKAKADQKADFGQFFEEMAEKARIPKGDLTIGRPVQLKHEREGYVEVKHTITIARANRNQVAAFCYNVEAVRDYLQVRRIDLRRDVKGDDDWEKPTIDVVYREPLQ